MKQMLEALERGLEYAKDEQFENAQKFKGYEHLAPNDSDSVELIEAAITAGRQAIEQAEKKSVHESELMMNDHHYRQEFLVKQEPVADKAFEKWWDEEGSTAPKHRFDCEEHCYQIAKIAWSNGAYKACEATPQPQREWVWLTPADFDWLEQVFANKVSNNFVFADIVCVISAKLKERNG